MAATSLFLIDNREIQQMDGSSCYGEINSIPLKVWVASSASFKQVLFWNSNTSEIEVFVK